MIIHLFFTVGSTAVLSLMKYCINRAKRQACQNGLPKWQSHFIINIKTQ